MTVRSWVMDTYRMLNEDWFTTGGEDGSLALWFAMKKKPAVLVPAAHGYSAAGVPRWISAVGCLKQSDLVVSGSNDGAIRLWRADVEARSLEQVSACVRSVRLACVCARVAFRRRRRPLCPFMFGKECRDERKNVQFQSTNCRLHPYERDTVSCCLPHCACIRYLLCRWMVS